AATSAAPVPPVTPDVLAGHREPLSGRVDARASADRRLDVGAPLMAAYATARRVRGQGPGREQLEPPLPRAGGDERRELRDLLGREEPRSARRKRGRAAVRGDREPCHPGHAAFPFARPLSTARVRDPTR